MFYLSASKTQGPGFRFTIQFNVDDAGSDLNEPGGAVNMITDNPEEFARLILGFIEEKHTGLSAGDLNDWSLSGEPTFVPNILAED